MMCPAQHGALPSMAASAKSRTWEGANSPSLAIELCPRFHRVVQLYACTLQEFLERSQRRLEVGEQGEVVEHSRQLPRDQAPQYPSITQLFSKRRNLPDLHVEKLAGGSRIIIHHKPQTRTMKYDTRRWSYSSGRIAWGDSWQLIVKDSWTKTAGVMLASAPAQAPPAPTTLPAHESYHHPTMLTGASWLETITHHYLASKSNGPCTKSVWCHAEWETTD